MTGWAILFWLIVVFLIMHPLKRWINAHVQGVAFLITGSPRLATWFFWVLFLPGTLLHELSHWLTAVLLGVRTGGFSLWPKVKEPGRLQMGAVQIRGADPLRHSLIGLAPLIFGSGAVLLIGLGWLDLERLGVALARLDFPQVERALANTLAVPDVWLGLYLLFTISNAMLPSASDREAWRTVLLYLGLALVLALGLGLNPFSSPRLEQWGLALITHLFSAFAITVAVDIFFVILIFMVETLLEWVLGRQVQYQ